MKPAPLTSVVLVLAFAAAPAAADGNIWQRAREPDHAASQLAMNRIERTLGAIGLPEIDPEMSAAAIAMSALSQTLPSCSASDTSTPSLTPAQARFDYLIGGALLDSRTDREADARCILERALRSAPGSPLAADGWFHLGIAAGKLGDHEAERAAYVHALELTWQPDARAAVYGNLGDTEMTTGDLKAAIREYRLALAEAQELDTLAATYFGLAVALDRSGDLPSALDAAERAIQIQLPPALYPTSNVLDLPDMFFVPEYDIHYYKAIGAMAAARRANDDGARRDALAEAVEQWTAYLGPADADHAPWAPRAHLHEARIRRELAALTKKVPKITGPTPDPPSSLP